MTDQKKGLLSQIKELVFILLIAGAIRTFVFGLYQVPTGSMETTMLVGERFFADKLTPWFSQPKRGDIIAFNDPTFKYAATALKRLVQMYVWIPMLSWGPENWTKRVIGIPGDRVQGRIEDGKPVVYVNGVKLQEPYLNKYPLVPIERTALNSFTWQSYDPALSYDKQLFYRMNEREVHATKRKLELENGITMLWPGLTQAKDVFDITLGDDEYWAMGDNRLNSKDSRYWGPLPGRFIHARIVWRLFSLDSSESWFIADLLKNPLEIWSRVRWIRCFQRVM